MIPEQVLDKLDIGPWCFGGWHFRVRDTLSFIEFGIFDCFLQRRGEGKPSIRFASGFLALGSPEKIPRT